MSIDKIGISRSFQYKNLKGPIGVFLTLTLLSEFKVTNVFLIMLAALLTFISALLFTIKKDNVKVSRLGIVYASLSSILLGITALIQKYVTNCGFVFTQTLYQSVTIMITSYLYILCTDKNSKYLHSTTIRNKILSFIGGLGYYFATFFNTLAYKYLPASIAFTIVNMSGIWAVLIGILFFKEINFKENHKRIILGIIFSIIAIFALLYGKN